MATHKLEGKHSTAHHWRDKSNCATASRIIKLWTSVLCSHLILYIHNNYGAHSWLQPSESSSASAIVSSALTQALGDALFWAIGAGASGWKASAYLSRAFSQFFWDFDLLTDMLSTDRVVPDPRPDWDVLIFSSICRENDRECQDRVVFFLFFFCLCDCGYEISHLTGSFIPVPSLPSPSPFFQPIFSNIFRPLLTWLISL